SKISKFVTSAYKKIITISPKTKPFAAAVVLLSIISLIGCVAAIPLAVKYAKEKDMVKLTLQVDGNASDIFDASVRSHKRKSPETEVIKDDREKLIFEGKKVEKSGIEIWGRWKAKQISEGKTEVDFRIKAEGMEEEALEKRAVSSIQAFCSEIGKRCKIEK
ncbi:MAG: hypothetical protein KAQ85_02400, partial [Thermodesulfovibrionia bacterium]|nr:hypothetical protein [Thermodesulfovibrionia bacterium]